MSLHDCGVEGVLLLARREPEGAVAGAMGALKTAPSLVVVDRAGPANPEDAGRTTNSQSAPEAADGALKTGEEEEGEVKTTSERQLCDAEGEDEEMRLNSPTPEPLCSPARSE